MSHPQRRFRIRRRNQELNPEFDNFEEQFNNFTVVPESSGMTHNGEQEQSSDIETRRDITTRDFEGQTSINNPYHVDQAIETSWFSNLSRPNINTFFQNARRGRNGANHIIESSPHIQFGGVQELTLSDMFEIMSLQPQPQNNSILSSSFSEAQTNTTSWEILQHENTIDNIDDNSSNILNRDTTRRIREPVQDAHQENMEGDSTLDDCHNNENLDSSQDGLGIQRFLSLVRRLISRANNLETLYSNNDTSDNFAYNLYNNDDSLTIDNSGNDGWPVNPTTNPISVEMDRFSAFDSQQQSCLDLEGISLPLDSLHLRHSSSNRQEHAPAMVDIDEFYQGMDDYFDQENFTLPHHEYEEQEEDDDILEEGEISENQASYLFEYQDENVLADGLLDFNGNVDLMSAVQRSMDQPFWSSWMDKNGNMLTTQEIQASKISAMKMNKEIVGR